MSEKKFLGIDIGYAHIKIVEVNKRIVTKTVEAPMPKDLMRNGRIVSKDALASIIKDLVKINHITTKNACILIHDDNIFIKEVNLPQMTEDQLRINLPYEFKDYITNELNNYYYDYQIINNSVMNKETNALSMELLGVAVLKDIINDIRSVLKKAGLRCVKISPAATSLQALVEDYCEVKHKKMSDYCILDLGYHTLKMYIFNKGKYDATRILDPGISRIAEVVSNLKNVDIHVAQTYVDNNFENCNAEPQVVATFNSIGIELKRAVNFLRFSSPDSNLQDIYICGGGSNIEPLIKELTESIDLNIHPISELFTQHIENANTIAAAVGITFDD